MFRLVLAMAAILLVFAGSCAATDEAARLAAEYQALRAQSGHFSGGEWNDAVDRFQGRKHVVMQALGGTFGDGTHTKAQLIAALGTPDAVAARGDALFTQSYDGANKQVNELLVYEWRGRRDYLYFTSDGSRVLGHGWWMAWE